MKKLIILLFTLLFTSLIVNAQDVSHDVHYSSSDSAVVIQVLNNFQKAVIDGNKDIALRLLAEDVNILEGGGIETRQEYLSHHFHSDGKFLSAMKQEVKSRTTTVEGNVAWVSTKTHVWGAYNERELNLNSLELTVLKKADGMWKISALHWSSSSRK